MQEIHFVVQAQGGAGKTTVAILLANYLKDRASEKRLHCFDADPISQAFGTYRVMAPKNVITLKERNIYAQFDGLMEAIMTEEGIGIIDVGTTVFLPFLTYMQESNVLDFLAENNVRTMLHVPVADGLTLNDSMRGLIKVLDGLQAETIVWLNSREGSAAQDKIFKGFPELEEWRDNIISAVHIPNPNPDIFNADIQVLINQNLTLTDALNSNSLDLKQSRRLSDMRTALYESLDKVPFLHNSNP